MIVWFSGNGHLWQHTLILDAARYLRLFENSEVGATPLLRADRGIVARTHGRECASRRDKRALSIKSSVEVQSWPAVHPTQYIDVSSDLRGGGAVRGEPPVGRYPLVRGKIFARAFSACLQH